MAQLPQTTLDQRAKDFGALIQSPAMIKQLQMVLPRHVTPERIARLVLTEVRRTPKLLECTRESLLGAMMQAAQLGLEPGVLGQCWILPFNAKNPETQKYEMVANFIPGYRGLAQLAWRSGMIAGLSARAVFDGDTFDYDFGSDKISHIPRGETDPDKITHAWTVIHTTQGGRVWDVMLRSEIDAIRKRSKAGTFGPWVTDFAEMSKKTVFRRNVKLAPCSVEMHTALTLDDAADQGISQGIDFEIPETVEAKALAEGSGATLDLESAERATANGS